MSERKVLNKYYPPDFDPSKIPRMKLARNRQYTVRLMAPFNMRCETCGEYIYKGKKFNARKEDVEGDDYLGIRIYRFYIKCTRCLQEISFKTDPKNTDYEIEAGATQKRTQQSKQELELLESLEELKDLNRRQQTIDYDQMLEQYDTEAAKQRTLKEQEEEDEKYVKSIFNKKKLTGTIVEEEIVFLPDNEGVEPPNKFLKVNNTERKNVITNTDMSQSKSALADRTTSVWSSKPIVSSVNLKKSNLGVKIIPKSSNEKSDEPKSGLSLLGTYSGSSSDDNE
ncbi:hypothetical protein PV327_001055 [Microctonus hyperodae]|uniref:Splicing factor YJU2 n=1 Tax=Microctonus hyperodae TaxID=165561 RepID=A0AA39G7Y5_MICHY|nr:hypothetical protein PV327_001055 [Microctonus hyperodae]